MRKFFRYYSIVLMRRVLACGRGGRRTQCIPPCEEDNPPALGPAAQPRSLVYILCTLSQGDFEVVGAVDYVAGKRNRALEPKKFPAEASFGGGV